MRGCGARLLVQGAHGADSGGQVSALQPAGFGWVVAAGGSWRVVVEQVSAVVAAASWIGGAGAAGWWRGRWGVGRCRVRGTMDRAACSPPPLPTAALLGSMPALHVPPPHTHTHPPACHPRSMLRSKFGQMIVMQPTTIGPASASPPDVPEGAVAFICMKMTAGGGPLLRAPEANFPNPLPPVSSPRSASAQRTRPPGMWERALPLMPLRPHRRPAFATPPARLHPCRPGAGGQRGQRPPRASTPAGRVLVDNAPRAPPPLQARCWWTTTSPPTRAATTRRWARPSSRASRPRPTPPLSSTARAPARTPSWASSRRARACCAPTATAPSRWPARRWAGGRRAPGGGGSGRQRVGYWVGGAVLCCAVLCTLPPAAPQEPAARACARATGLCMAGWEPWEQGCGRVRGKGGRAQGSSVGRRGGGARARLTPAPDAPAGLTLRAPPRPRCRCLHATARARCSSTAWCWWSARRARPTRCGCGRPWRSQRRSSSGSRRRRHRRARRRRPPAYSCWGGGARAVNAGVCWWSPQRQRGARSSIPTWARGNPPPRGFWLVNRDLRQSTPACHKLARPQTRVLPCVKAGVSAQQGDRSRLGTIMPHTGVPDGSRSYM